MNTPRAEDRPARHEGKRGRVPAEPFFETRLASGLRSALGICLGLRGHGFWSFRGQRNPTWTLGLHQHEKPRYLDLYCEQFRRRCKEFPPPDYIEENNEWRWLLFAQHHRLRTRLLDWTKNPLVAIYFAVENIISRPERDSPPGAVWALQVSPEHFKNEEELRLTPPATQKELIMVDAPPLTPSLARQSGLFTFHPDGCTRLDTTKRRPGERLIKIEFKRRPKLAKEIRKQLGILNIHHGSLFPDAQGVAEFTSHEWPFIALKEYLRLTAPATKRRQAATTPKPTPPVSTPGKRPSRRRRRV